MGFEYGRNVIGQTGIPVHVSADGEPEWLPIGISLDWGLVAALGADLVVPGSGLNVRAGMKYLRYGQVLCPVSAQPVQTVTITGGPTGGTFFLSGYRPDTGAYVQTAPLNFNATAADVQAALAAVGVFAPYPITVGGGPGPATPYTVTGNLGTLSANGVGLTGGAPGIAVATTTPVGNTGKWGPFDPGVADGRQALARGQCGILNDTVLETGVLGIPTGFSTNHPGLIVGGLCWRPRILATAAAHSLAAGPTWAELEAAMPRLEYAAPAYV